MNFLLMMKFHGRPARTESTIGFEERHIGGRGGSGITFPAAFV
jgi:hypothetical protein